MAFRLELGAVGPYLGIGLDDPNRLPRDGIGDQALTHDVLQDRVEPVQRHAEGPRRMLHAELAGPVALGPKQRDLLYGRRVQELVEGRHLVGPGPQRVERRVAVERIVQADRAGPVVDVAAEMPVGRVLPPHVLIVQGQGVDGVTQDGRRGRVLRRLDVRLVLVARPEVDPHLIAESEGATEHA